MVSKNAGIGARISLQQGDVFERILKADKLSESALVRIALGEYVHNHHPDMSGEWDGLR